MAADLAARTQAPVVVTLGGAGVLVAESDGAVAALPARQIAEVRDTTGAGDTFNGVFASALAAGATVLNASSRGVTAASLSVGWVGARAGMPRSDAIDAAHKSADPDRC
jgi:ribokinase